MKRRQLIFIAGACMISISCNNKSAKGKSAATDDTHTSANSLDWQGIYKGVLPCADCQGIATALTLNNDNTYVLTTKYLGKDSIGQEEKGNFSWDKAGSQITLAVTNGQPRHFRIGENKITQLDMNGNKITGALAENYVLTKQSNTMESGTKPNAELVETYWKLTELMGKAVTPAAKGVREMHMILRKQDNRIQAFAGCNSIMGSFELREGNLIRFNNVASTKMACNDMTIENQYLEVLEKSDNYSILGDQLSLNKARMAPLARFEAVYH